MQQTVEVYILENGSYTHKPEYGKFNPNTVNSNGCVVMCGKLYKADLIETNTKGLTRVCLSEKLP